MYRKLLFTFTVFLFFSSFCWSENNEELIITDETDTNLQMVFTESGEGKIAGEADALVPEEAEIPAATEISDKAKNADKAQSTDKMNAFGEAKVEIPAAASQETEKKIEYIEIPFNGMDRAEVEKFRQMYLTEKWSKLLSSYLETAMPYRLYVRKCLQELELPEILEYLPVVESNYKTNAVSRSGAIGMWQFMANSVKPFLELNDYVDERLDPWKSTDAALKKLTDNYNYFQDWLIAIAAYNCGVGAMNKYIKKGGVKDFWYLVDNHILPNQTAMYVPKLLAIADLVTNCEYYGLNLPSHDEEYELLDNEKNATFDYLTVNKAYSISQLAREMRMDEKTLKNLNPSFIMGFTHPSKTSKIRLPLGMENSAKDALAKIEPIDFPFKYTVVAGDSLWSISRRYGVTVSAICELNGINENAILKIGKTLYIPKK